jgi:excinuclease ABC subunit C
VSKRAERQLELAAMAAHVAELKKHVRANAEDRPGVYRMHTADGEVLYVGKSKKVRSRLLSYFRLPFPEEKGARLVREAARIDWEYVPSEFAALLLELQQVKRLRPRFNFMLKRDARHFAFIKVSRPPAARLMVVRGASDDRATYYGPFQGAQRVAESVRELSDVLGLRDCTLDSRMRFADQAELFTLTPRTPGCIRYEVRKCLGPCVAACTEKQYDQRVALARAFLDGADDTPVDSLRIEMLRASAEMEYERAASMRDKLERLEALRDQFERLRFAVESLSFLYTVPGWNGEDRVYLIRKGRVRAEDVPPVNPRDRRRHKALVEQVFTTAEREGARLPTHEIDELLLLSWWFRTHPAEMERTTPADGTKSRRVRVVPGPHAMEERIA